MRAQRRDRRRPPPRGAERLVLAAVAPYRDVLARQVTREEAQRRALTAFLDDRDAVRQRFADRDANSREAKCCA
ncbi:hypothetical protein [Streptomyces sp. NPDC058092]|uniref:hypothetical protein n=1 Tax=Streptomyces sp. NPDC058092 TaxID=3346336 RepID=UPI0036E10D9A